MVAYAECISCLPKSATQVELTGTVLILANRQLQGPWTTHTCSLFVTIPYPIHLDIIQRAVCQTLWKQTRLNEDEISMEDLSHLPNNVVHKRHQLSNVFPCLPPSSIAAVGLEHEKQCKRKGDSAKEGLNAVD